MFTQSPHSPRTEHINQHDDTAGFNTVSGWRWQSDARFNIKPPCVGVCPPVQCTMCPAEATSCGDNIQQVSLINSAVTGPSCGCQGSQREGRQWWRYTNTEWVRVAAWCPAVSSSYRQSPSIVLSLPPDLNFWQPLIVSCSLHHHNTTESIRQTVVYKLNLNPIPLWIFK